jgi:hypothetical protein
MTGISKAGAILTETARRGNRDGKPWSPLTILLLRENPLTGLNRENAKGRKRERKKGRGTPVRGIIRTYQRVALEYAPLGWEPTE